MKRSLLLLCIVSIVIISIVLFLICRSKPMTGNVDGPTSVFYAGKIDDSKEQVTTYECISMEEASAIFETECDYIILDVRRSDEFGRGHIPGAINIANESIDGSELAMLPDKEQTIYVYCRSGNRSKQAAEKLANMGYTKVVEFGGIIDWTGELE